MALHVLNQEISCEEVVQLGPWMKYIFFVTCIEIKMLTVLGVDNAKKHDL